MEAELATQKVAQLQAEVARLQAEVAEQRKENANLKLVLVVVVAVLIACAMRFTSTSGNAAIASGDMTAEQLRAFSGSVAGRPIYAAFKGNIYDVSDLQHFQQGGRLAAFAGVDNSRAYALGRFAEYHGADVSDLSSAKQAMVDGFVRSIGRDRIGRVV